MSLFASTNTTMSAKIKLQKKANYIIMRMHIDGTYLPHSGMSEVYRSQGESYQEVYQKMCEMAHERFLYYDSLFGKCGLNPEEMNKEAELTGYKYSTDQTEDESDAQWKIFQDFCRQHLLAKVKYDPDDCLLSYVYVETCYLSYQMSQNAVSISWTDNDGNFFDEGKYQEYSYQIITIN